MNNLTKFNTIAEYNDFLNSNDCPYVNTSYIVETDEVKYFKDDLHENTYFNMPFTIEILSIGQDEPNCKFFIDTNSEYLRYKINNGEWTVFNTADVYLQIDNIVVGDKIQVISKTKRTNDSEPALGELDIWRTDSWDDKIGGDIKIYGNVMSVIVGDGYLSDLDIKDLDLPTTDAGYFTNFIDKGRAKDILVDADNLWLPYRDLPEYAYKSMFKDYTRLEKAPTVNANGLAANACKEMFMGCGSLTGSVILKYNYLEPSAFEAAYWGSGVTSAEIDLAKFDTTANNPAMAFYQCFAACQSLATLTVKNLPKGWGKYYDYTQITNEDMSSLHTVYNYTNEFFLMLGLPETGTFYYVDYGAEMSYDPASMVPEGWTRTAFTPNTSNE